MKVSERFCFSDADITFQSIDGVLFKVHKRTLSDSGPGFLTNIDSSNASEGTIHLPEESSVLELLFQYVYPRFRPCLDRVAFHDIEALGNAAEKYEVVYAIIRCWLFMRMSIAKYPDAVLAYAMRHRYADGSESPELLEHVDCKPLKKFSHPTQQLVSLLV